MVFFIFPGEVLLSYMTRDGWGASKPDYKHLDHLRTPVEYAIITHTAQVLLPCSTTDECCMTVKEIQKLHMTKAGKHKPFRTRELRFSLFHLNW